MRAPHRKLAAVTSVFLAATLGTASLRLAEACGGFFTPRAVVDERRPSLAYEQALIIFDSKSRREHFIRDVVFRDTREPFGFVVPVPSKPEVAKAKQSPFSILRARLPFEPQSRGMGLGAIGGRAIKGGGGAGVQIIEVKKVGSFTSFVLRASDAGAFSRWLRGQGFVSTPEADDWVAYYVKMGFYYVAMRYEPPKTTTGKTLSETIRISFDTPLPYYPYREPERRKTDDPRMLEIWLASRDGTIPVAARTRSGKTRWVRPFAEGVHYSDAAAGSDLKVAVGDDAELLFDGSVSVQRFMDQKRSRSGFGDVVFVPKERMELDEAARKLLAPFMAIIDPSLVGARK